MKIWMFFRNLFKAKILNKKGAEETWALHVVRLIQKKANTSMVNQFRPIALLSSIYKWYSIILALLAGPSLSNIQAPQFAFRTSYQVSEVTFILNILIEKAIEFEFPLFICDGDLAKAYDYTEYSEVILGCEKAGVHRTLVAAWVRELSNMSSVFRISSLCESTAVRRFRSLVQGDPAAPSLFNLAIDVPATEFIKECTSLNYGYNIDGKLIPLIMFADNFWLLATSDTMLKNMIIHWDAILRRHGHHFPRGDLIWTATIPDDSPALVDPFGSGIPRRLHSEGFKAKDSIITTDGRNTGDLDHRIVQFEKALHANSRTLRSSSTKIASKLRLFQAIMRTVLFWGAGTWNLTVRQLSRLRGVQQQWLRRILRIQVTSTLDSDIQIELNRETRAWAHKAKIEDIVCMFYRLRLEWAGHIARLHDSRPESLTPLVWRWRCAEHLKIIMLKNNGSQMHGRRVRVWRWEALFTSALGDAWYLKARDRAMWQEICWKNAQYKSSLINRPKQDYQREY